MCRAYLYGDTGASARGGQRFEPGVVIGVNIAVITPYENAGYETDGAHQGQYPLYHIPSMLSFGQMNMIQ